MRKTYKRLNGMTYFARALIIKKTDILAALVFVILFLTFIPVFTYAYYAEDMVNKEDLMNRKDTGLILLDRYDRPFFSFYQAKRKSYVPLSEISPQVQQAIIAIEDKEFYQHPGFSLKSILRSLYLDLSQGSLAYGGSTITQQLVKNALLTPQKNVLRKYQEVVLASEIEKNFSKEEILEMYLNSAYFGSGAFGIEEAAQTYFGKSAKELDLAEASLIAGVLPAPSALSPHTGDFNETKLRQTLVLEKMAEQGYITNEQKLAAENENLKFSPPEQPLNTKAIHFALMVKDQLVAKYGEEAVARSGFKVRTSIDLDWQEYAEQAVQDQVRKLRGNQVSNGAAVVMDPKTGEIKAMVGSINWYDEKFGRVNVTMMPRQPGSSFKPIVYVAAFEEGLVTPATILNDRPVTFATNYKPRNYDGKFRGQVTVRRALSNSLNVPSVEIITKVGVADSVDMAKRLGITTLSDSSNYGPSLVLGAGEVRLMELTTAYATFANEGKYVPATAILEIKDKSDQFVYVYRPEPKQVLHPEDAFLISSILSDTRTRQEVFGKALDTSRIAAVKTGTTENYRDSLTIGYTPSLAVGVWVGNNDGRPMDRVAGSLGAAPIWKALIEKFSAGTPNEQFAPPQGSVIEFACRGGGAAWVASSSAYKEYFAVGTQPPTNCVSPDKAHLLIPTPTPQPDQSPTPTPEGSESPTETPAPTSTPEPTSVPNVNSSSSETNSQTEGQSVNSGNNDKKEDKKD